MPLPQLWSICFFLMLVTVAFDSLVSINKYCVTAVGNAHPNSCICELPYIFYTRKNRFRILNGILLETVRILSPSWSRVAWRMRHTNRIIGPWHLGWPCHIISSPKATCSNWEQYLIALWVMNTNINLICSLFVTPGAPSAVLQPRTRTRTEPPSASQQDSDPREIIRQSQSTTITNWSRSSQKCTVVLCNIGYE